MKQNKRKRVIFIPGFYDHKYDSYLIKLFLRKKFKIIYFDYKKDLTRKIETSAKQLKNFIKKLNLKKGEKISLIALSIGGLVAKYYLNFIDNKKVDKLITLCTPFKGTPWANIFFKNRKGMEEIRPNSKFLKKLNKKKIKNIEIESVYSEGDIIVPNKSGKHTKSKKSLFFLHIIQFWPPAIFEIKRFLED